MDLKNLVTDKELEAIKLVKPLIGVIKNKYFNLGRDWVKLEKLFDEILNAKENK